jgi:hypothetical protein
LRRDAVMARCIGRSVSCARFCGGRPRMGELERAPHVRMLREPTRRIRFLTHAEAKRLLSELPEHLADMAAFSLATGLRAANGSGMEAGGFGATVGMGASRSSEGASRHRAAIERRGDGARTQADWEASDVRVQLPRQGGEAGQHQSLVPGASPRRDRGFPSWHVQNGTPLFALQELGGWQSPAMVRRYAHLAADHLAPYAQRLRAVRAVAAESDGTNTAQRG